MAAQIIDGKAIAAEVRLGVARDVAAFAEEFGGAVPGLATILVGDDPASAVYIASKQKACKEVGMQSFHFALAPSASREEVVDVIARLNARADVSGILCQLPVPEHLDGVELTGMIEPLKDVDGLTPISAGLLALGGEGLRPCTPSGVMHLLDVSGVQLEGMQAVVIGRSNLFGKPMTQLLLGANATVTTCHSRTRELAAVCRRADVLIAAVGRAQMVQADWVKPGAVVIDVGMNRLDGKLVGDVDLEAVMEVASMITPVPGGDGPLTPAFLLSNTLKAARMQRAAAAAAV